MTQAQARQILKSLLKQWCTCECDDIARCEHKAGCRYRIEVYGQPEPVKELAGPLYAVA